MIRRFWYVVLQACLSAGLLGCSDGQQEFAPRPSDTSIYEVVVLAVYADFPFGDWKGDSLLVTDSTASYSDPSGEVLDPPRALPRKMRRALQRFGNRRWASDALHLPENAALLTAAEVLQRLNAVEPGTGVFSFSPVVYSEDGNRAVVYYEFLCGALCGRGSTVVLKRSEDGWHVQEEENHWIS